MPFHGQAALLRRLLEDFLPDMLADDRKLVAPGKHQVMAADPLPGHARPPMRAW